MSETTKSTITDAMVEAAARIIAGNVSDAQMRANPREARDARKRARAALEAAEAAAWCDDMSKAPKDERILVAPSLFSNREYDIAEFEDDEYAKTPRPFWRRISSASRRECRATPPRCWYKIPAPPQLRDDEGDRK
jgi:hypothetical protein